MRQLRAQNALSPPFRLEDFVTVSHQGVALGYVVSAFQAEEGQPKKAPPPLSGVSLCQKSVASLLDLLHHRFNSLHILVVPRSGFGLPELAEGLQRLLC